MFGERAQICVELVHFLLVCERGLFPHSLRVPLLPSLQEGDLRLGLALVEGLLAGLLLPPAATAAAAPCCGLQRRHGLEVAEE